MTNAEIIWKYFEEKKFTPYAIAGIMGNLQAESSLKSNNLQNTYNTSLNMSDEEYTAAVDNNTYTNFINDHAGYGIAQWTFWSLKQDLYNLCQERKKSISDINCQLDCLYMQLQRNKIIDELNSTENVREASDIFLTKFERPRDQSESVKQKRANYGLEFYNQFVKSAKGGNKMKYSSSNKPLVCMMTQSSCYKGTSRMAVKGILWHCTGANNPNLKRYVQPSDNASDRQQLLDLLGKNTNNNDWNHKSVDAGVNAWIGKLANGSVTTVQTLPWDYKPWGCGSGKKGSCNNGWIQFEICEDALTNKTYFDQVYQEACQLTAYLCKMFSLNPKGSVNFNGVSVPVILCHQDSYRLGLGSNHADVYNWFNRYGKTMDDVRNDVANIMVGGGTVTPEPTPTPTPTPKPSYQYKSRELGKGDSGNDVKQLQENLIKLGYDCGPDGADGDFGNNTEKAVLEFQKDKKLVQDGIVGPKTYAAIDNALKALEEKPATPTDELYRVRTAWDNSKSQVGAYKQLQYAISACKAAGGNYKVFDSTGKVVYPVEEEPKPADEIIVVDEPTPTPDPTAPTPATTYSGVKVGSSSKDENGQYRGGSAGDQTGKEVYILNWYNGAWTNVIRPKSAALAEKIAQACEKGCNNNNIGYDQYDRNSLYREALKVGMDLSKITTPCECDCSSFVSVCCIAAGLSADIFFAGNNMCVTGNLIPACDKTGQFDVFSSTNYTKSKDYLKRGDILLSNGHTVIVLSNGDKAGQIVPIVVTAETYKVEVTASKLNVRSGPGTNYAIVTQVTRGGVYTIIEEKEGWGRLKSGAGWIALEYTRRI